MLTKKSTRDIAGEYVAKHGKFIRDGVYVVRWPLHAANGLIMATDTDKLADALAERMNRAAQVEPC